MSTEPEQLKMKENFRSTDKPKKRRVSYQKESQAALREAIRKAHSRIVGDVPLRRAANE